MKKPAQDWLTNNTNPATTTKILPNDHSGSLASTEVKNPGGISGAGTDNLTGKLTIKDYVNLEEIDLSGNEIEEIIFINCPKLKKINVSMNRDTNDNPLLEILDIEKLSVNTATNEPEGNALKTLKCGGNKIIKVDFTYCQNLKKFECPNNKALDRIENLDKCKKVEVINMDKSGPVRVMNEVKQAAFKAVAEEVKEIFEVEHVGDLPMEEYLDDDNRKQHRIKKGSLKAQLMNKVAGIKTPQLKTEKENAEKERDEAKTNYDTTKAEQDQLQQQLTAIRNELGLTESTTKEQIIDKIKELMNRPTSGCSHADYDNIKKERDGLKTDNESKKRKIDELEGNKENEDVITKKVLTKTTNTNWGDWGVKISNDQINSIQNAVSAEKVEEIRNEIIKDEFIKLKDEKNGAFYLNVVLGTLTIGSLLILGWLIMRETNLPKTEPDHKKDKKIKN